MAYSIVIGGSTTISESGIVLGSVKVTTAVDLIGAQLSADTLTAIVDIQAGEMSLFVPRNSDSLSANGNTFYVIGGGGDVSSFRYGTSVVLYDGASVVGKFFLTNIVRVGRTKYKINAVSGIGLLDNQKHYGGIYNTTAGNLIQEILSNTGFSYTVDMAVSTQQVRGWLPVDTRRNNLHKVLFAVGASVVKDASGNIKFVFLNGGGAANIPNNRIFVGGSVDYPQIASAAETTEHAFYQTASDPTEQLYDSNSASVTNAEIVFTEPHYNLTTTGTLTISESGVNYAIVSGSGTLSGKKYTHDKRVARLDGTGTYNAENLISSHDDALVNALNSANVLKRMLSYYSTKSTIKASIVNNGEKCGDVVSFENAFGESDGGIITQMDSVVSTFMKSNSRIITGYTPTGQGNNYTNRSIVTTNGGSFTVPSGVTKVRMVLIAPGNGGDGGYDGENGYAPNNGNAYSTQTSAHGGAGGSGGSPGKVYVAEYDTSGGETFSVSIGSRGSAGTRNGGTGGTGGNTSVSGFVTASTTSGTIVNGYLDPVTNEVYAAPGADGETGGDGGMTDIVSLTGDNGEAGFPGGDSASSVGGNGGSGSKLTDYPPYYAYASGGGGGGAAHGANGGNGGNAGTSRTGNQLYSVCGNGGNGANATAPASVLYGCGGSGGHGGGGGGNGGGGIVAGQSVSHVTTGTAGTGGTGTAGAQGGAGCAIFYY